MTAVIGCPELRTMGHGACSADPGRLVVRVFSVCDYVHGVS
jgi:hypothetical protein